MNDVTIDKPRVNSKPGVNPDDFDREIGDEGLITGMIGLEEWKVAAARVIARCWDTWNENDSYYDQFNHDPIGKLKELGYQLPEGLVLKLNKVDVKYEKVFVDGTWENGWKNSLKELSGQVIVNVPPPPKESDRAMAIVDYQATGKSLPFTC